VVRRVCLRCARRPAPCLTLLAFPIVMASLALAFLFIPRDEP
jgi:hypothetical protein